MRASLRHPARVIGGLLVAVTLQIGSVAAAFADDGVRNLSVGEVADLLEKDSGARVLDVRLGIEFRNGHIEGAQRINYFSPFFRKEVSKLDRGATWVVHCKSGHRSVRAVRVMHDLGFDAIVHMDGGFDAWRAAGLPVSE